LFSPGTPVSFTNKTDHHDIAEILLKVALNTITLSISNEVTINMPSNFNILIPKQISGNKIRKSLKIPKL
jgi:hypothetical protein